jgi:hypothetical protein
MQDTYHQKRMFWPFIVAITCTTGVLVHRMALRRRWTSDDNLIYFASHAALNAYVCQTALPYVVDMLDTNRFISSTPGLLPGASDVVFVICGFHLYHVATQWWRLSISDWLHHLVSVGASTGLFLQCDHAVGCAILFFMCGLPGWVDYTTLMFRKAGWTTVLTQKRISSLVHVTIRMPGILWCCVVAYQIGLDHPNRRYFWGTCILSAANGLYFGYDAIRAYGKALACIDSTARSATGPPALCDFEAG